MAGDPNPRADSERRSRLPLLGLALVAALLVVAGVGVALVNRSPAPKPAVSGKSTTIDGLASYTGLGSEHVKGAVKYEQSPPVGGDHSPVWENCGWYDAVVPNEQAVHSMEHGAVWVTYDPALGEADKAALKHELSGTDYVVASPYPGLPGPVVASAWGKQVVLDSATDPRLAAFVKAFAGTDNAPEMDASCTDGAGTPTG
ncbi:MAG: DUF3105 domain-containing protein [Nocardioides sp.]